MSNVNGDTSKKILSVDFASDLKNANDAYRLVHALLNILDRPDVSPARIPTDTAHDLSYSETSYRANTFHIQISIFERRMS